jgi:capsular polysaccharide biosynthesis protein
LSTGLRIEILWRDLKGGGPVNNTLKYTPPAENEEFFSVADMARVVRKRLWMVILLPLLAVGAAVGVSLLQPPVYEATATVVVSPTEGASQQDNLSNKISGLQILAHEMAVVGLPRSMVEEVVNTQGKTSALSAADLNNNLTVAQVEDTRFLSLSYLDTDSDRAQEVVNSAAEIFTRKAPQASGMAADAAVKVSAYATAPKALEGPDPLRNGLLALGLGLMLGIGLALLLEHFVGSGWHSPEEVERASGVPTFGPIPDFEAGRAKKRRRGSVA